MLMFACGEFDKRGRLGWDEVEAMLKILVFILRAIIKNKW